MSGLRREEVAEAAGISVAWYTWMEQARDLTLSTTTLEGVSRALRLDDQEEAHFYRLAGHAPPARSTPEASAELDAVRHVIAAMEPNPTYALDSLWNLVAWNRAAAELFGFDALPAGERNLLSLTFASANHRARFGNWHDVAQCVLAHFRADSVDHVESPTWRRLIEHVAEQSEDFRAWWPQHDVTWPQTSQKEVHHPVHGARMYQSLDMEVRRPARLRIVVYVPASPIRDPAR